MKALFVNNYGLVCSSINRVVQDKNLSEDIAQEVFIKFWNKSQQLNIETSITSYLRKMAINEAISYLRKKKRRPQEKELPEHFDFQEPQNIVNNLIGKETQIRINEAINQLPPKCRLVFQLSRFEELSYREIAEKLDISIKTVENQMSKALKFLRLVLKNQLD